MNVFHLHLTEDQGWRIEIKKYPRLTEVGSKRKATPILSNRKKLDGKPYGGYYTQDELREIVTYAKERYITVVPEIEMPGHSIGALAAYPELGCTGGPYEVRQFWGVETDVYCAGEEKVYEFLENVLLEVFDIFPSEFIHIGGDECPKARWEECPKCQAMIEKEGLKNEHELQSYFITRMEKCINKHNRRIIGWDEILEGGLAPNAAVMSWRGIKGGFVAANMGHDVVMSPTSHCYLDYYQSKDRESEPPAIGGFLPLEKVYSFNPVPDSLDAEKAKHILGAQGNVWTEYIPTPEQAEYMAFPRGSAIAEVVWSPLEKQDYAGFRKRLEPFMKRLDIMNVNYRKPE
jgi:hexosaminidase